jgi:hypothetical protein
MRKIAAMLLYGVAAASASAAADDLPGFTLAARTAHFSFYTRGARVEPERSERFLAFVETTLGHELDGRANYYRYERMEDIGTVTGAYAQGITYAAAREIHSTRGFHAHEIVHLVAGQLGDPGPFLQEGLAVAIGNMGRWNGKDVDVLARQALRTVDTQELLDHFDRVEAQLSYPAAGSFARSLIRRYGVRRVAELFRACPGPALRDGAFERTFGVPLAQAAREWEQSLR